MTEDCFTALKAHGQRYDEGIRKLMDTWRYPHNILGGYGADAKQAETDIQILKSEITTLKETIHDDAKSRATHVAEMDTVFEQFQQMYEDLVQSCNDIETVLSEYGYVRPEDENTANKLETGCSPDSSLISSDMMDDLVEVEFTPDMTWRHKLKINIS